MIFNKYAQYYNLIYSDKNYPKETEYIRSLLNRFKPNEKINDVLDIGCGTGTHALLLGDRGYKVTGIDLSQDMIDIANTKKTNHTTFLKADATDFNLHQQFDVVLSLFHVINYHTTNQKLNNAINLVSSHLKKGGLFIFDSWYGPAVLTEQPSKRTKDLEDRNIKVRRIATPLLDFNANTVEITYNIDVLYKKNKERETIEEIHTVRYLFKPEIEFFLSLHSIELIHFEEWLTSKKPGTDTWGVCFVGRKT